MGSDHDSRPSCNDGHFGIGKLNENGQRLLELCSYLPCQLYITNRFFSTNPLHRSSCRQPRSHQWHQLDLTITRRPSSHCLLVTRSFHSPSLDTDHSLKDCSAGNAEERSNYVRDAIYNSTMDTLAFGKRERRNSDWFEASIADLEPAIEAKIIILINYRREPYAKTLAALRKARNDVQRISWRWANDYWLNFCQSLPPEDGIPPEVLKAGRGQFSPPPAPTATAVLGKIDCAPDSPKLLRMITSLHVDISETVKLLVLNI